MQRFLPLVALCLFAIQYSTAQCVTHADFSAWIRGGTPGNGNWVLQNGNTQVEQTINGNPTFFYSPFDMMNVHVTCNFKSTDADNDYMGLMFSYLNPLGASDTFDCWLFDWKQGAQDIAPAGMSLNHLNGVLPPATYSPQFWGHTSNAAFTCVANHFGGQGWVRNVDNKFEMYLTYNEAKIYINDSLEFDWFDCFKVGRFGFYNYSQQSCYFSNFQYDLFIDYNLPARACAGDSVPCTFLPACNGATLGQYQNVTWNFGDGTTRTINNPTVANVNVNHAYATGGNYTVTLSVTDNNGCSASKSHTVVVQNPIVLTPNMVQPTCNGNSNGSIAVTATGGLGNYTYNWTGGPAASTYSAIPAGTYILNVADSTCSTTAVYVLNEPPLFTVSAIHTDVICHNGNDGALILTTAGGTVPYTYQGFVIPPGTDTLAGLTANVYAGNITDAHGCTAAFSQTIAQPDTQSLTLTGSNSVCFNDSTGLVTAAFVNATSSVIYNWNPGGILPASRSGLAAGTYTVTATDLNNCTLSNSVTISQPNALNVAANTVNVACFGAATGSIALSASGGTGAFTYAWSPQISTDSNAINLPAGMYNYTVSDANNCSVTQAATITQAPQLNLLPTVTNLTCYDISTGAIATIVTGGTSPFTYALQSGGVNVQTSSTGQFNTLAAGSYTVVVTDANLCAYSVAAAISQPDEVLNTLNSSNVTCYELNNGKINMTTTGGTPQYTYTLSNGLSNSSGVFNNLAAGDYGVTITDANNCTSTQSTVLTQPDSFAITVTPTGPVVKLGDTVQLLATSNQPDQVTFSWQPETGLSCTNCPNPVFNNNYTTVYNITGVSSNGCAATYAITVTVTPGYPVFIPNVFTPNGDGKNDVWQVFGQLHTVKQFAVSVFNRWGEKVYESNDINAGWDGTFKGSNAPAGVYVYEISFVWLDNHSDDHYQGTITLLR